MFCGKVLLLTAALGRYPEIACGVAGAVPFGWLRLWGNNTSSRLIQAKELRELLKFSATITKTEGIRYTFYESSSVMVRFIDEYLSEKQCGTSRMTSASLLSSYRKFLHASGFTTDESIRELERAAGTILTGMVMLINLVRRNTVLPSSQNPPETWRSADIREIAAKPPRQTIHKKRHFNKQLFTDTKALYERMNQGNLAIAHERMNEPLRLGTVVQTQRRRDAIFNSQKGYRIEKHCPGRRFRFRRTRFKVPDDFDIEKGCWIRAEYDKDSHHLSSRRYAEMAKASSVAANLCLIVTGKDVHGSETSFYAQNSGDRAPGWVEKFVEWYERGLPEDDKSESSPSTSGDEEGV